MKFNKFHDQLWTFNEIPACKSDIVLFGLQIAQTEIEYLKSYCLKINKINLQ